MSFNSQYAYYSQVKSTNFSLKILRNFGLGILTNLSLKIFHLKNQGNLCDFIAF